MQHFTAICLTVLTLVGPARADQLLVFAAASLRGALDEIVENWPGAPVAVSYAGSATLARQIEQGAPADIYISANTAWMDHLDGLGLLSRRQDLIGNRLVLAGNFEADPHNVDFRSALEQFPPDTRIATGFVTAVPAGIYARQSLEHLQMFEEISPRLVQTENVRIALSLVARGEVEHALVYRSDVAAEPDVHTLVEVPQDHHDPIHYPIGLLDGAAHPEAASLFGALLSAEAQAIFLDHGFEALP